MKIWGTVSRPVRARISSRAPGTDSTSISSTATPLAASRLRARSQYGHQSVTYMRTFGACMRLARLQARDSGRLSARQAESPPRSANTRLKPCAESWRTAAAPRLPLSSYTTTVFSLCFFNVSPALRICSPLICRAPFRWPAWYCSAGRRSSTTAPWFISRINSCGDTDRRPSERMRISYTTTRTATTAVTVASQGWWLAKSRTRSMGEEPRVRAKKGAHYSAPTAASTLLAIATLAVAPLVPAPLFAAPAAAGRSEDARKAEEQLQAVKAEIERVTREVSAEQVERDRLTRDLRGAELAVAHARDALADVRHERAEDAARRAALAAEKRTRETQLDQNRAALAGQMR